MSVPTVSLARVSSTAFSAAIAGVGALDTAHLYYRASGDVAWTPATRTGPGTIPVTGVLSGAAVFAIVQGETPGGVLSQASELATLSLLAPASAATGWLTIPMLKLRDMLAACPSFQAWTGTIDPASALSYLYPVESAAQDTLFPCGVITQHDGAWRADADAMGVNNTFVHRGGLVLRLMKIGDTAATDPHPSHRDMELAFGNEVGGILDDLLLLAGSSGMLDIDGGSKREGPAWTEPDQRVGGRTLIAVTYELGWRG